MNITTSNASKIANNAFGRYVYATAVYLSTRPTPVFVKPWLCLFGVSNYYHRPSVQWRIYHFTTLTLPAFIRRVQGCYMRGTNGGIEVVNTIALIGMRSAMCNQ